MNDLSRQREWGKLWFPRGLPPGKSVFVASSRLGRELENRDRWFDALRTLAVRLDPKEHFFLTAAGTAADHYVRHVARRFGFKLLELCPVTVPGAENERNEFDLDWADESQVYQACGLPPSDLLPSDSKAGIAKSKRSLASLDLDDWLLQLAEVAYVLSVRPNGRIERAVLHRLSHAHRNSCAAEPMPVQSDRANDGVEIETTRGDTWLLIAPQMTPPAVQQELLAAGALGWWLYQSETLEGDVGERLYPNHRPAQARSLAPILSRQEFPADQFLIHWTRARQGPWPDQTDDEFLDDLLFKSELRRHGSHFALRRILATRRILANRRFTRDACPVVCFSNRSLHELPDLTVFRSHLGRWDFVPYGIAVERHWVSEHGGRPVIYGDERTWQELDIDDQPFFQLEKSKSGKLDWTIEQEWRWLGDFLLTRLPQSAVAAFVATHQDAEELAPLSRWPIVVIGED